MIIQIIKPDEFYEAVEKVSSGKLKKLTMLPAKLIQDLLFMGDIVPSDLLVPLLQAPLPTNVSVRVTSTGGLQLKRRFVSNNGFTKLNKDIGDQ